MNGFEMVIGYDSIKAELLQVCDMIHNKEVYERLGAKTPKGLLLYGEPGVGKSLMSKAFIEESGRKAYIIRRNKPNGDFVNEIRDVFKQASENLPSVILLDDMDKFVVEEDSREEFVALQSAIDEVHDLDVYIIATANDIEDIPKSLLRSGRFDRKIEVKVPQEEESIQIIRHYMATKSVVSNLNIDDVAKMLEGKSCAEIETILNEAAVSAAYERKEEIEMDHIVNTVLREEYGVTNSVLKVEGIRLEEVAYHEAGHVVISEVLEPGGIGIASIRTCGKGNRGGFVSRCFRWRKQENQILMSLAGKVAVEWKKGVVDSGAASDLDRAVRIIKRNIKERAVNGVGLLECERGYGDTSTELLWQQESVIHAELERGLLKCRKILVENQEFLEAIAKELLEKGTLLNSDIKRIRKNIKDKKLYTSTRGNVKLEKERKIIAVDFDGTLSFGKWPDTGSANIELIDFLKERKSNGDKLILWTCREGDALEVAVKWCEERELVFDAINDNIPEMIEFYGTNSRKVSCDYYIDDRAVRTNAFELLR